MSNLNNLTSKILNDAKEEADKIVKSAEEKAKQKYDLEIKKAIAKKQTLLENARRERELLSDRIKSSANLKARNEKLKAKQTVINKVIDKLKAKLVNMNESDYINYLNQNIDKSSIAGKELIVKKEFLNEEIEQEKDFFNGYFSEEKLDIDERYIVTTINETSITNISKQLYEIMGPLINTFIFLSTIFLAGFIYSLMKIITDKNTIQISYLKIFGYTNTEISKIYIHPITITILISLIVLIPLELYAVKEIMYYSMLKFSGYLELYISTKTIILSIILTLTTYIFVSLLQFYKISKMNFNEILKNRE